jgi:predicted RNA binding protein YcfA (HicA-like mRNA interferase family)
VILGRLKPLPYREVKRRLEKAGFQEVNKKGSHVKFVRRSGETVDTAIVPNKRDSGKDAAKHPQSGIH